MLIVAVIVIATAILTILITCIVLLVLRNKTREVKYDSNVAIVGTARDIESYIPRTMENIYKITTCFANSEIIIYENDSKDNTLQELKKHNVTIISETGVPGSRTVRLAHGRNKLLEYVKNKNFDLMIVVDMDDVMEDHINLKAIRRTMDDFDKWDIISFNRDPYYDIWALRYAGRDQNWWGIPNGQDMVNTVAGEICSILKKTRYFKVKSAFNSFAMYKTSIFGDCKYDGNNKYPERLTDEDCEHVNFHNCLSGYRHFISSDYIVNQFVVSTPARNPHDFNTYFFNRFGFQQAVRKLGVVHTEVHELPKELPSKMLITDSNNTDYSTGRHTPRYDEILDKVQCWFATNVVDHHPKIVPYHIGIDYHSKIDELGQTPIEQDQQLLSLRIGMKPFWERKLLIYTNIVLHNDKRILAKRLTPQHLLVHENVGRLESWKKQLDYAFVLSPEGNGIDCHRTWEALALGCIPIVKSTGIDPLYDNLPVLIVDEWSNIDEKLLKDTIAKFAGMHFNYEKLTLKYWVRVVEEKFSSQR